MRSIAPCLWFNGQALEAARFYVSLFKESKILRISRYTSEGRKIHGHREGEVLTVEFQLEGKRFIALNGGPQFRFSEAVSFAIDCRTQKDIDYFWNRLSRGGKKGVCGWLKDRFGLSWQVVPFNIDRLLGGADRKRAGRVMKALLKMKKPVIASLEKASRG